MSKHREEVNPGGSSYTESEISKIFTQEEVIEKYQLPAIGLGLIIHSIKQEISVSGVRKIGNGAKVSAEDKWHIGSCTKSMTATLAAVIIGSGKYPSLTWETKLKDVFDFNIHPDFRNVTLPEILAHRSGIMDPTDEEFLYLFGKDFESLFCGQYQEQSSDSIQLGRLIIAEKFLSIGSKYDPSMIKEYQYSNLGYVIAGTILEKITGQSWEQLMLDNIFIPLEMYSAGFGPPAQSALENPDQPWGHHKQDEQSSLLIPSNKDLQALMGPAGLVHCSIPDLLKYTSVHIDGFNGLDTKILSASEFKILHEDRYNLEYTPGGWMLIKEEGLGLTLEHEGSNGLNEAAIVIAPELKSAIIVVMNCYNEEVIQVMCEAGAKRIKSMDKIFEEANQSPIQESLMQQYDSGDSSNIDQTMVLDKLHQILESKHSETLESFHQDF